MCESTFMITHSHNTPEKSKSSINSADPVFSNHIKFFQILFQIRCYTDSMKRLLNILIILSLCLLLPSCAQKSAKEEVPGDSDVSKTPQIVSLATASPAPTAVPPVLTPVPDRLNTSGTQYTFAWFSDPQFYSKYNNGVFESVTEFLASNRQRMNLSYIIFTGDFVHNTRNEEQWKVASDAMKTIDEIPNGVCSGNHDVGTKVKERNYTLFSKYFGEWRYKDKPWYGGGYSDNKDHFDLIDAGNTQYVFVYLGYQVDPEDLEWACSTFDTYRDRVGILCTHDYFYHDCSMTEYGQLIFDSVVCKCPNLYAVLCGHRYNSNCIPIELDDDGDGVPDRTVLQMICNYQAIGSAEAESRTGGDGYIRFLKIDEDAGMIYYTTYSPYLDDYVYFDEAVHRQEKYAFDPSQEEGSIPIPWAY